MTKKETINLEAETSTKNYLGHDLKKVFLLTGVLVLLVVILVVLDSQTGFLTKFTHSLVGKLIGK